MTEALIRPRWAPRVPLELIKRLYVSDVRGLLDDDLVDEVGVRLYARCESILTVREIMRTGRIPCPACGATIQRDQTRNDEAYSLHCLHCGWELQWLKYWNSFRHNELAYDVFVTDYLAEWLRARDKRQKMLAIDRIIHRWHNDTKEKRKRFGVGRPSAVNLLEGSRRQVIQFLDSLTSNGELKSSYDGARRQGLAESRKH